MLPSIPRISELKTMITMPEEKPPLPGGHPAGKNADGPLPLGAAGHRLKLVFPLEEMGERMQMLIKGASPVANTAPKIPMPQGR